VQQAMGQWDHALGNANEGAALAEELGHHALCSEMMLCSAWIAAARGDEQECARLLERAARHQGRSSAGRHPALVQWIHGLAALSDGRPTEAFERLRGVQQSTETPQHALLRRLSTVDLVEAAVQVQRQSDVVEVVEKFAAWVDAGSARWAQLDLARCRALLDDHGAERWYLRALELSAATGRLPASARTEFQFGAWLRRNRRYRESREHLRIAEEHFVRIGAAAWSRRAHSELRAAGESNSPRRRDELTPQEREIALLAADGFTNRQIAAKLALSPRTVGYHLYKIFPKLDITSRMQLPAALNAYSSG
jgi:DNA-binding CsgD family transcriptional regulator